jgi:hypothetical protein
MTDDEFLKLPHIAVLREADDHDFVYDYFLLSPIEDPQFYPGIHMLNVIGSYVMDRSNNRCKLEFPDLNYSANFYNSDYFEFIHNDFIIKFNNPAKFNELAQKLILHLKNEITKNAINDLD